MVRGVGRAEFIVMTESGVNYSLLEWRPASGSNFVANENCNCSECPYIEAEHAGEAQGLPDRPGAARRAVTEIMARALKPLERMLAVK